MLSKEAVERIKTKVFPQIDQLDLILVCDFGNGFFHYELVDEIKKADIHIFRNIRTPADDLDKILLEHDFFEVRTTSSRIFTVETFDSKEGVELFRSLIKYFEKCGGIKKIEYEEVKKLLGEKRQHAEKQRAMIVLYEDISD